MAEGSSKSKSRSVLVDVTNRIGKRGISTVETGADFNGKDGTKRLRGSPRLSAEVNSSKGDVACDISRIQDENESPNVAESLGGDGVDVDCLKGNDTVVGISNVESVANLSLKGSQGGNFVVGRSKVHGGSDDIEILDLGGADQSRTNLGSAGDNGVGNFGNIGCSEGVSSPIVDKIGSQDDNQSNSMDVERPRADATASIADDYGGIQKGDTFHSFIPDSLGLSNENDTNMEDIGRGITVQCADIKANSKQHDSFAAGSSWTVSEAVDEFYRCRGNSHTAGEEGKVQKGTQSEIYMEHNDQNADDLILSQSSSVNTEFNLYSGEGMDAIRACPCQFCTKAAHMWFDLHHQDARGRLTAIRKSQRAAVALAERSSRHKVAEKHGAERITGVSNVESQLTNQWRSLFQGMANIWDKEGNHLESSLQTLAGLREKCKADMAPPTNTKPSEEH